MLLNLKRKGFYRVVSGKEILELDEFYKEEAIGRHPAEFYILVDRLKLKGNRQRIADALETAFREGNGSAIVETTKSKTSYSDRFVCRNCEY